MQRTSRSFAGIAAACLLAGCQGSPSSPSPDPSEPMQITGFERIGWDQPASSAAELSLFSFRMYVDNVAVDLSDATCDTSPGTSGYPCNSPLPPLAPGAHTLELTAFVAANRELESNRSSRLSVFVLSGAVQTAADGRAGVRTRDAVSLTLDVLSTGLVEPVDLAVSSDHRVFIAERSGRIVLVDPRSTRDVITLAVPDVHTAARGGLLGIALDPTFADTSLMYAVYTTSEGFELARFRLASNRLVERIVLLDRVPATFLAPAAALRFGPDGALYAALDDGGDPQAAGDPGSYNGKVLRLNPDGTTPTDQPSGSPVTVMNVNMPRGLDWVTDGGTMWLLERDSDGVDRVQAVVAGSAEAQRGTPTTRYSLPAQTGASALAVYRSNLLPDFRDNLLVAADDGAVVLRLGLDPADTTKIVSTEPLLEGMVGGVRALAVGPDGMMYLVTADTLLTLQP